MEKWKKMKDGYDYSVCSTGRIRRNGASKDKAVRNRNSYLSVDLYRNGKRSTKQVARLVAEAFVPNPDNKPEVNHKDGDKYNNDVSNLEWVTKKENVRHAWKNGLMRPSYGMRGKSNPNAGRKGRPFRIVETGEVFGTLKECEEKINGNSRHINDCLKGRQTTHRGYHFEYV